MGTEKIDGWRNKPELNLQISELLQIRLPSLYLAYHLIRFQMPLAHVLPFEISSLQPSPNFLRRNFGWIKKSGTNPFVLTASITININENSHFDLIFH